MRTLSLSRRLSPALSLSALLRQALALSFAGLLSASSPLLLAQEEAQTADPELPSDGSSAAPLVDPAVPGSDDLINLAPAAFASPANNWNRVEDQAGWLSTADRDGLIQRLDDIFSAHGVSLYIATAPSGQGNVVLSDAQKNLQLEMSSGAVAIYVLSGDRNIPMVYTGSERLKQRLGEDQYFTMNAAVREAVTKETLPGRRLNALFVTIAKELGDILAREPAPVAEEAASTPETVTATPAASIPATEAPAEPAAVPPPATAPAPAPAATVSTPAPAPETSAATEPADTAIPETAEPATEPQPYLWVTLACLGALVIVGGGAWFLLNLYRPVEVTPRAADRVQEQKRQQALVRNRVNGEKRGVGALVSNVTNVLQSAKTGARGTANHRAASNGAPAVSRRSDAPPAKPEAAATSRRTAGEPFEQRLWRCFGDYSRMHYGRRPESFTPQQIVETQQHELFAVLDEYLTYFKWLSSQALGRSDKKAAKIADERYHFLYGASNLLKRCAPTLRNHLMGGLEAFLRECAEEGAIPGVAKQRRPAGIGSES